MKKLKDLDCILLIDDEEINNFLHSMLIKKTGIDVHIEIALNGQMAIDYLTCKGDYSHIKNYPKPGLIFLDINMPRMNGWEFLERYMQLPEDQKGKMVVAMLTSSINPDDQKRAESIKEISHFISKPLSLNMLEEIIYKYFHEEVSY